MCKIENIQNNIQNAKKKPRKFKKDKCLQTIVHVQLWISYEYIMNTATSSEATVDVQAENNVAVVVLSPFGPLGRVVAR